MCNLYPDMARATRSSVPSFHAQAQYGQSPRIIWLPNGNPLVDNEPGHLFWRRYLPGTWLAARLFVYSCPTVKQLFPDCTIRAPPNDLYDWKSWFDSLELENRATGSWRETATFIVQSHAELIVSPQFFEETARAILELQFQDAELNRRHHDGTSPPIWQMSACASLQGAVVDPEKVREIVANESYVSTLVRYLYEAVAAADPAFVKALAEDAPRNAPIHAVLSAILG